jgi:hypothetical protein
VNAGITSTGAAPITGSHLCHKENSVFRSISDSQIRLLFQWAFRTRADDRLTLTLN